MSLRKLFVICALPFVLEASVPTILDPPQILNYVEQQLNHTGFLRKSDNGMVYLEVAQTYITAIIPMLNNKNIEMPPYFEKGGIGAHVTVILPGEVDWSKAPSLPWGAQIPFNIAHFVSVVPDKQPPAPYTKKVSKLYLFTLEAAALESLRLVVGLPPQINGQEFHITVGVEYAGP